MKKKCPLLMNASWTKFECDTDCIEDKCAWWHEKYDNMGCCAILDISS